MRALLASELLAVWEQEQDQVPVQQALGLLAAACPERSVDALAQMTIGQRDALLLTVREQTFGRDLVCVTSCPDCGERLELAFAAADIRAPMSVQVVGQGDGAPLVLETDGYHLLLRPPTSADLMAVADSPDPMTTRRKLLDRCLLAVQSQEHEVTGDRLPAAVVDAAAEQLAQADPQADVRLALSCPCCGHQWDALFDIVSFFWAEINAWATRVLRQVHSLATAYGWHEADILNMSSRRRQTYLEMAMPRQS